MLSTIHFPTGVLSSAELRALNGIAFAVSADGQIHEANLQGWSFVERWWQEGGRLEIQATIRSLQQTSAPTRIQKNLHLSDDRRFTLECGLIKMDTSSKELFLFVGDETLVGLTLGLSAMRRHYGLTWLQCEILAMAMKGRAEEQIAQALEQDVAKVREELEKLVAKLPETLVEQKTS